MGIAGLLQFLKDASEPVSVRKYKGQTLAVDTYCWLHKGAFSCAEKLAKGEPTDQYVTYCMKFVDMLLSFGVKPILVFDGCNLPSKAEVEKARRERRQANLQKGKQLLREGKLSEARDCFTRCVNVTPAMAHHVIKAARSRGVDCVVAPYEADAQLAFLNKTGIAQGVITEDSDLLAFGCRKVILKMDKHGNGLEIDQNHLGRCRLLGNVFTEEKFRHMCILSGCDYLASLHGIGLGKACKLLKTASNPDVLKVIRKMGQYLKMSVSVPDEYIEGFVKANNTFLYQLVFDPIRRKVVPLNPYPDHIDPASLAYAGQNVGDRKGLQMALGNLDINTMAVIDDYNPDTAQPAKPRSRGWDDKRSALGLSIWSKDYSPEGTLSDHFPVVSAAQEKSSTRGQQRTVSTQALRLPSKDMQIKRPREELSVTEGDVLQQYSSPSPKKQRRGEDRAPAGNWPQPGPLGTSPTAPSAQPRARNRFATLLQRRNQEEGLADGQGTRSRFFCNGDSSEVTSPKLELLERSETPQGELHQSSERLGVDADAEVETAEAKARVHGEDGPCPVAPVLQRTGAFDWSASSSTERASGLSMLQRFQRRKEGLVQGVPCKGSVSPTPSPSQELEEDEGKPADSPPSQDSAYFSQPSNAPSRREHSPPQTCDDLDTSQGSNSSESISCSPVMAENRLTAVRAKASGLPRIRSTELAKVGKIRPSAPARASGLRRKPDGQRKKSDPNNENRPGLQATISGLWKNFGFRKDNPKVGSHKTGDPMSPVKENVPALTPETEKDVYFIPENAALPKTICF